MLVFLLGLGNHLFLPEWKWSEGYGYVIGLGLS